MKKLITAALLISVITAGHAFAGIKNNGNSNDTIEKYSPKKTTTEPEPMSEESEEEPIEETPEEDVFE